MKYVGVDLHRHVIVSCVVSRQGRFEVVVEATAAYEWFFVRVEDLADRLVLAHPKKLRVIAESTRKTDNIDAEVLAVFLALDLIPEAYRPCPRVRQYRVLVRHRCWLQRRITTIKSKLRNILGHYNADVKEWFTQRGEVSLAEVAVSAADRFAITALKQQWGLFQRQLGEADRRLREFAKRGPLAEQEARAVLESIPQVGPVTIDVVLSEVGDWRRFRSQKALVAFAGLDPGMRSSADKRLDLHISKEGSRLLRWTRIQAAWRLVVTSPRWHGRWERRGSNTGFQEEGDCGDRTAIVLRDVRHVAVGPAVPFGCLNGSTGSSSLLPIVPKSSSTKRQDRVSVGRADFGSHPDSVPGGGLCV